MLALTEVDGGWSTWGPWDDCNVTCQLGTRTRSRYVFYKFQIFKAFLWEIDPFLQDVHEPRPQRRRRLLPRPLLQAAALRRPRQLPADHPAPDHHHDDPHDPRGHRRLGPVGPVVRLHGHLRQGREDQEQAGENTLGKQTVSRASFLIFFPNGRTCVDPETLLPADGLVCNGKESKPQRCSTGLICPIE